MTTDEIELLKLENKYLAETVLCLSQELARTGMCEYSPDFVEFIELAEWGYGILSRLEIDISKLESYGELL